MFRLKYYNAFCIKFVFDIKKANNTHKYKILKTQKQILRSEKCKILFLTNLQIISKKR